MPNNAKTTYRNWLSEIFSDKKNLLKMIVNNGVRNDAIVMIGRGK